MIALLALIFGSVIFIIGIGWVMISILKNPVFALNLLIFFLPFERIPSFEVGGLTIRINHLIGGFTLLVWLVLVVSQRRKFIQSPLLIILTVFVSSLLLSLLAAQDLHRGVMVVILTLAVMTIGLLIPQLLTEKKQIRSVLVTLAFTTLVSVGFGLYQFLGDMAGLPNALTGLASGFSKAGFGLPRVQAFGQEPLYFGNFLLLPIGVAAALLLSNQRWFARSSLVLFLIVVILVLGLTLSRGAILGLAGVGLALFVWQAKPFFYPKNLVLFLSILLLSAGIGVAVFSQLDTATQTHIVDRLTVKDFGQDASTVDRLSSWYESYDLWQTSPIVGIGAGNFGPASLGYPAEPPASGYPIVNNEFIELLVETGMLGLATFLFFLTTLFLRSVAAYKRTTQPEFQATIVGLSAALFGMLVQYNFFSTLYITSLWITFGILIAVQNILLHPSRENRP